MGMDDLKGTAAEHPTVRRLVDFNTKISKLWAQFSPVQLIPGVSHLPTAFNRELSEVVRTREEIFNPELRFHQETFVPGVTRDLTDGFLAAFEKEIAKEERCWLH